MYYPSVIKKTSTLILLSALLMGNISTIDATESSPKEKTLHIAVASNFKATLLTLIDLYQDSRTLKIVVSSASTGKLATQIRYGAPYDILLAADTRHPTSLIDEGLAYPSSFILYAQGQLALISRIPSTGAIDLLRSGSIKQLAIANPITAPYGAVAKNWLTTLGFTPNSFQYLRGENISQTWHFFQKGGADAALIALSQILQTKVKDYHYWLLPQRVNQHLMQAAVILTRTKKPDRVQHFMTFLQSDDAINIIQRAGYRINNLQ